MFLVTTVNSFFLFVPETGEKWIIDRSRGAYFGLTYNDKNIFVAARYAREGLEPRLEPGRILVYDYNLRLIDILTPEFPLRDLHQIYFFDDKVFCSAACDNIVPYYDLKTDTWERWIPEREINREFLINSHYNSLWSDDDFLYITSNLKTRDKKNEELELQYFKNDLIARDDITEILIFNKQLRFVGEIQTCGFLTHDLWKDEALNIYQCGSRGEILCNNLPIVHPVLDGMPRGVFVNKNDTFIGVSEIGDVDKRKNGFCQIISFDKSWNILEKWTFQDEGNIHCIKSPGTKDWNHPSALGKNISMLYTLGREVL